MQLLILTDREYPCSESFLREVYSKRFPEQGDHIGFVMYDSVGPRREERWNGCPVYVLPESDYRYRRAVADYVSESPGPLEWVLDEFGPPDVVQVRNHLSMGLYGITLAEQFGVPFFYRVSHLMPEAVGLSSAHPSVSGRLVGAAQCLAGRVVRRKLLDEAERVLPISETMDQYLGTESKSTISPMGVNTRADLFARPRAFRDQFDLPSSGTTLLYLGKLSRRRNPAFLVGVLAAVLDRLDASLVVVGGERASRVRAVEEQAEELGASDRVTVTGWIDDQEMVAGAIESADVGLSPLPLNRVYRCSSPTKVLEYLNHATPAVVSPVPDQATIVEASGGGIVAEYDPKPFADAVVELCTSDGRDCRGADGRAYVREHRSYDIICERIRPTYTNYV